eukprot:2833872-Ditylum_brightwellii.AAC.1
MHGVSSSDSKYNILRKILPHDFLLGTSRRRVEDREVWIWIHGMQQRDWSTNKRLGKKFVLGTGFEKKRKDAES